MTGVLGVLANPAQCTIAALQIDATHVQPGTVTTQAKFIPHPIQPLTFANHTDGIRRDLEHCIYVFP